MTHAITGIFRSCMRTSQRYVGSLVAVTAIDF